MTIAPADIGGAARCLHSWSRRCSASSAMPSYDSERLVENRRFFTRNLPDLSECSWAGDSAAAVQGTLALLRKGRTWIQGAILTHGILAGEIDLLRKVDEPSLLGSHSYRPILLRFQPRMEREDVYEVMAGADLLEPVLGSRPRRGEVWLSSGQRVEVDLDEPRAAYGKLLSEMNQVREGTLRTRPYRCGACETCPWFADCSSWWEETDHVSLLRGVRATLGPRFEAAGFGSWRTVARSTPAELGEKVGLTPERARTVWLHARARETGLPHRIRPVAFPRDLPVHFYDIETYAGRTYLHGVIRVFGGEREERQFLAPTFEQEREAWHGFLDFLARDERALVYSWTDYERGFVRGLWERHGGNPDGWRHLEERLVDLCAFVKDHFALPVYSYSIKKVAPVFGFHWDAPDASGWKSMTWYREWRTTGDEMVLRKLMRYNRDDVAAMEVIFRALEDESRIVSAD